MKCSCKEIKGREKKWWVGVEEVGWKEGERIGREKVGRGVRETGGEGRVKGWTQGKERVLVC